MTLLIASLFIVPQIDTLTHTLDKFRTVPMHGKTLTSSPKMRLRAQISRIIPQLQVSWLAHTPVVLLLR